MDMDVNDRIDALCQQIVVIELTLKGQGEIERRMIIPMTIDRQDDSAKLVDELIVAYVRLKAMIHTRLAEIETEMTLKSRPGVMDQQARGDLANTRNNERKSLQELLDSLPKL